MQGPPRPRRALQGSDSDDRRRHAALRSAVAAVRGRSRRLARRPERACRELARRAPFQGREASRAARCRMRAGGACMAVGGLGKRQGALVALARGGFRGAVAAAPLSAGASFGDAEATPDLRWASPTEPTASSAIGRSRAEARGEPRAAGERRSCASSRLAGEALTHGARLDQHAGIGSRARRARGRRPRARRAPPRKLSGVGGRGAAQPRTFRPSMRWDARAPRRRAWSRSRWSPRRVCRRCRE